MLGCVLWLAVMCNHRVTPKNVYPITPTAARALDVAVLKACLMMNDSGCSEESVIVVCWNHQSLYNPKAQGYVISLSQFPQCTEWRLSCSSDWSLKQSFPSNATFAKQCHPFKWGNIKTERKWALPDKLSHSSQWNSFHRWPLAVRWLLRQWDGKIHVVPFEICSCVMPTRAEYCQSTKAITLLCPFSHTHIYTNMDTHSSLAALSRFVFNCDVI